MAKSPLSGRKRVSTNSINSCTTDNSVIELDMSFTLIQKLQNPSTINLRDWCYFQCDPSKQLANFSRVERMKILYSWVKNQFKNKFAHETISETIYYLKRYIIFCDSKRYNPFSKAGYLSYCGNVGELRRLVNVAYETKPYLFMYEDGEELGLQESKAAHIKIHIDKGLMAAGFSVSKFQTTLKGFQNNDRTSRTVSYSDQEWELLLRRFSYCFHSLAIQLIKYREEFPDSPPPKTLEVIIDHIDGKDIKITLSGKTPNSASAPFQQCMFMGYILFSYYTAFNTSTSLEIRFPINTIEKTRPGRTQKYVKIRGYKGRASKDVQALFASLPDQSSHKEAIDGIETGFVIADIDKRDKNGIKDGLTFIEIMKLFSQSFNNDKFGKLFYSLNSNFKPVTLERSYSATYAASRLEILSDRRVNIVDHVVRSVFDMIINHKMNHYFTYTSKSGSQKVSKKIVKIGHTNVKRRVINLSYVALRCLTNIELKNIIMPLHYSERDEDGFITVSFSYVDGSTGQFLVDSKYQSFLTLLESFSKRYNRLPSGRMKKIMNPPLLLPIGCKGKTRQWKEDLYPFIAHTNLLNYGIYMGDYFLSINSSRVRKTNSDLEYKPEDNGFSARLILQHSIETQSKNYVNGHPKENKRILSQGLSALTNISKGMTRNQALEKVKSDLNIPILSYDEYIRRNMPTNPNGLLCDGKLDISDTKQKDWHYSAKKWAEKEGIIKEGQDISCYQYDLCIFCKGAQLVNDAFSIYKLLSFLEALNDGIDVFPQNEQVITNKIIRFREHLINIPPETIVEAEDLLFEKGRYFLFKSTDSVIQYIK